MFIKQQRFLNELKKSGIKYKLGFFQKDSLSEKEVDVKIAVDMIRKAYHDEYDIAYLVSGDGDLKDSAEFVREMGKKIYNVLVYHKDQRGFSYRLRNACDQYFYINDQINNFGNN